PTSGSATDRSRRLDSDAAAVQIATVHATKGLEFPIVYVPFSWESVGGLEYTNMDSPERGTGVVSKADVGD
ncbi:3'-5' exonuclease, partial [Streptomyces sp. NPDC002130]|uniref:3'-5' exonuclease n=1 Tax=Streptomyces sp. NPDC002130 TaxID=3155568 RepID=UPI003316590D